MRGLWWSQVILLSLLCSSAAGLVTNYSFALFWPQFGVSADANTLFTNVFQAKLSSICLANGVTLPAEFSVRFTEFLLPSRKPTNAVMNSFAATMATERFSFAGATSALSPGTLRMLRSTGDFQALHWIEPPPLTAMASSLITVVRAIQLPPGAESDTVDIEENHMLVVVVGPPYRLADVQQLLRAYDSGVMCFAIDDPDIVAGIEKTYITTIMVLANRTSTKEFVYNGLDGALWSPDYRWILFDSGLIYEEKPNLLSSNSRNITAMEFGPYGSDLAESLKTTEQVMLYDLLDIWTAFMANQSCDVRMDNQTLIGLTGRFNLWADGTVVRQSWRMAIYRNLLAGANVVGNISSNGIFNMAKPQARSSAREDVLNEFRRLNLSIYVLPGNQYSRYKKGMENATDVPLQYRLEGMAIDLCLQIFANLGISNITFVLQRDMNYGTRVNGEWNGIVKSLIQGGADMACVDLTITSSRKRDIDFSTPFLRTNMSILYKVNKKDPNKDMFQFMFPFSTGMWFYLVGATILVAIVLTVLHRINPNKHPFDLKYSMFFTIASVVQGVVGRPPTRPSGRIGVTAFWLLVTLLLVAYVSNYAAMRTLERMEVTIVNVFSLIDQTTYTYGTLVNSTTAVAFQTSSFADLKLAYERMRKFKLGFYNNTQVAVAAVNQGKFAMISDTPSNEYNQQLGCNLVVTGQYQSTDLAFSFPKRSDLRKLVNDELNSLLAKGKVNELYRKYFIVPQSQRPTCDTRSLGAMIPDEPAALQPEPGALTLHNTFGLLIINIVGCLLTLLIAGAEYGFDRMRLAKIKKALNENLTGLSERPRRRSTIATILEH